jgi:hypothetical protein
MNESYYKPWFDNKWSRFVGKKIQAKSQWSQDSSQINIGYLDNVRHKDGRHFKKKKWREPERQYY